MRSLLLLGLVPQVLAVATGSSDFVASLPKNAKDLFTQSMSWLDAQYDPVYGYLFSPSSAYRHNTRNSAYYAIALLARNKGSDVVEAERIIHNIVNAQFKDPEDQWFGTYQKYPQEPTVGTAEYKPVMYDTFDLNWRGFVGCALIIGLEEFGDRMKAGTRKLIQESLKNATIGDTYRVGGVDHDNLYPAYSNPSLMRALVSAYTGNLIKDDNMTSAAETYASQIIELFDRADTLSEFNSGTYTGVSLWALTMWCKYTPTSSIMHKKGPTMLVKTWETASTLYHPTLKNFAGPWDRSYGYDMRKYLSIIALHFWTLLGKSSAPLGANVAMLSHSGDFSIAPMIAILAPFHDKYVNSTLRNQLTSFSGKERSVKTSAYSPPWDYTGAPRNISAWMNSKMSIGAETLIEDAVGGPSQNQKTFNPAVIQWWIDVGSKSELGVITLYATEPSIHAVASRNSLEISYPNGTATSTFQLLVTQMASVVDVDGWDSLPNLKVEVDGNVDKNFKLTFNKEGINDFLFWNFTYSMPQEFVGMPKIQLKLETE